MFYLWRPCFVREETKLFQLARFSLRFELDHSVYCNPKVCFKKFHHHQSHQATHLSFFKVFTASEKHTRRVQPLESHSFKDMRARELSVLFDRRYLVRGQRYGENSFSHWLACYNWVSMDQLLILMELRKYWFNSTAEWHPHFDLRCSLRTV